MSLSVIAERATISRQRPVHNERCSQPRQKRTVFIREALDLLGRQSEVPGVPTVCSVSSAV